jgi:hypothetical protein
MRLFLLVPLVWCAGCQCGPAVNSAPDGGFDAGDSIRFDGGADASDAGLRDAGTDAGHSDVGTEGVADAGGFTLPLFRIGPRTTSQGAFGQGSLQGALSLPVTANTPTTFEGWEVRSQFAAGTVTFASTVDDGGTRAVAFAYELTTASSAPRESREIITATSADSRTVLMTVLDGRRELHFSLESTALQALALNEVRTRLPIFTEAYLDGRSTRARRPAGSAEQHRLSVGNFT